MTRRRPRGALGYCRLGRPAGMVVAAMLMSGVAGCWTDARANAPAEPVRVITHTTQYCEELSVRAATLRRQAAAPQEEARLLAAEGDRLCGQGQIRPGIIRLRRAIMLLRTQARPETPGR